MRHFSDMHPYVQLIFFITILVMLMFTVNPAIIFFSVIGGLGYTFVVDRAKFMSRVCMIPVFAFVFAIVNAALSHNGASVIFYMNDRRITLEALIYGAVMGVILSDVIIWTLCMSKIMTRDRIVYIFGKFPIISVVISMTFRYIPLFSDKYKSIRDNSIITGTYKDKNYFTKIKSNLDCLMTLITWILENGADTADSMEKRGFMTGRRSRFICYRLRVWDSVILIVSALSILGLILLKTNGGLEMTFYPVIKCPIYVEWIILAPVYFLPVLVELKEELKWKFLMSRI